MLVTSLPIASFAQAHQLLEWCRVSDCFSIRLKLFFALQGLTMICVLRVTEERYLEITSTVSQKGVSPERR